MKSHVVFIISPRIASTQKENQFWDDMISCNIVMFASIGSINIVTSFVELLEKGFSKI